MNLVLFLPAVVALAGFFVGKMAKDPDYKIFGKIAFAAGMFAICFGAAAGKFFGR